MNINGTAVWFTDVGPGIAVWFHPTAFNDSIDPYMHLVSVLCIRECSSTLCRDALEIKWLPIQCNVM